jgi:hypothetical protein
MTTSHTPSVVLAAYAEPLLEGHRVLFFGDATSAVADELLLRGARTVHVVDPEAPRASEAASANRSKQIAVVPFDEADLAVRDGAFDVALIADLTVFRDPERVLARAERALGSRGVAIVAVPNADAKLSLVPRPFTGRHEATVGYYELYDAVAARFPEVRMFGQTPFVGYAVVDFAPEGDPNVSLDSGLVPGGAEEPEWFVALASKQPAELDAFSIVQIGAAQVLGPRADTKVADELRAAKAAEARLADTVAELDQKLADARTTSKETEARLAGTVAELEQKLEGARTAGKGTEARFAGTVAELEQKLAAARSELEQKVADARNAAKALAEARVEPPAPPPPPPAPPAPVVAAPDPRLAELEAGIREALARAERAETELRTQRDDAAAAAKAAAAAEKASAAADKASAEARRDAEALVRERAARAELEKRAKQLEVELEGRTAERDRLTAELAARSRDIEKLTAVAAEDGPDDLKRLEDALRERAERIRRLETDLREAERIGRELVRAASRVPATHGGAPDLTVENARLKADLEALGWTLEELEGRLARGPSAAAAR